MEEINTVFARLGPRLETLDCTTGGLSFNNWNSQWPWRAYEAQKKGTKPDRLKAHEMEKLLQVGNMDLSTWRQ